MEKPYSSIKTTNHNLKLMTKRYLDYDIYKVNALLQYKNV